MILRFTKLDEALVFPVVLGVYFLPLQSDDKDECTDLSIRKFLRLISGGGVVVVGGGGGGVGVGGSRDRK